MAPKSVRGKGGKRGGVGGSTGVSGSADPPAPVDPVAQAAYLAAQLAVQAAMAASVNVPPVAVPLGRTASGHSLRLSAGAAAKARSPPVSLQFYMHPQFGTMPNIVPPRRHPLLCLNRRPRCRISLHSLCNCRCRASI